MQLEWEAWIFRKSFIEKYVADCMKINEQQFLKIYVLLETPEAFFLPEYRYEFIILHLGIKLFTSKYLSVVKSDNIETWDPDLLNIFVTAIKKC